MKPKAAIFDVFGTVVDWRGGVAAVMREAFAKKGVRADAEAFADAWRAEYQPAMERIRSGGRGYVALEILHRENLDRALATMGLEPAFGKADRDELNGAWERLPPWPDSVAGLSAMRAEIPVATCSNGSAAMMRRLARFGMLPWTHYLGADTAQDYKPKPEVYLASAAALGLQPGEVVMVAAHNDDLAAARDAGLATAFIPRSDEKGPGLGETAPTADWDFVGEDLIDLARRFAAA